MCTKKGVIIMDHDKYVKALCKLVLLIEYHFGHHGIALALILSSTIPRQKRFIFKIQLFPGTRVDEIFNRASDIGMALGLPLFQPFRDKTGIYLAVSKNRVTGNSLSNMLASPFFNDSGMQLPLAIGYDLKGEMVFADLVEMPHALYVGATNSGKSVGLMCLLFSLLYMLAPDKVNFLIFDIGANSMDTFSDIPHLSHPIVKDTETGVYVIEALAAEMERRISLAEAELRELPEIVCVMDEFVSFIESIRDKDQRKDATEGLNNLLRRGRKAKIHMVLATQDPTLKTMQVDISNITSRMAFKCAKFQASIAGINCGGAEKLPGRGAMLYLSNDNQTPRYVQGAYVSPQEAADWVNQIMANDFALSHKFVIPEFAPSDILPSAQNDSTVLLRNNSANKELARIAFWTLQQETVSANKIAVQFRMGNRADAILDRLQEMGIVSEKFSKQPRNVLPKSYEDIPQDVIDFLIRNGVSQEDIASVFNCEPEPEPESQTDPPF